MSRLVVKNLPKNITEKRLRELFSEKGIVTDVQLKYTKEGVFRQFGFVGFQTEKEGQDAIHHFNRSCIQTNRIVVEPCVALGADAKPKSWSKYAQDSSAYRKLHGIGEDEGDEAGLVASKEHKREMKKKKNKVDELLDQHKDDPQFVEFMKAHGKGIGIWENDWENKEDKTSDIEAEEKSEADVEEEIEESTTVTKEILPVKLADMEISDADYMKSLMQKKDPVADKTVKILAKKVIDQKEPKTPSIDLLTIKIRNIPFTTKRQDVLTFFKPIKPYSVRLPTKVHGICYVGFKNDVDFKKAMLKNRSFWKGKQILFTDFTEKNKTSKDKLADQLTQSVAVSTNPKWAKQEDALKSEEDISESGRIFFRNLPYTVVENDLKAVFEPYGPIVEINLPIDSVTRIIKGFGTVTYIMPEHAVKAFNELDGTIFHGRLLHLIPGKSKDDEVDPDAEGLSFKQRKELKQKQLAGSSHNWNTLFMGVKAVANVLAKSYGTSKEHILDANAGGSSAAVRLALGETEIILQMKEFLEKNDVCLDVFEQIPKKRSGTVIVAKNLPANTGISELHPIFSKFGLISRIVLPPSGVTALIEFLEPTEARSAFKKLAYSKFKDLPLYLEWAPENTFKTPGSEAMKFDDVPIAVADKPRVNVFAKRPAVIEELKHAVENEAEDPEDDTPPETNTTIFLRNLNFVTREPTIRDHFSRLGAIHMIQVAMKKDPDNPQKPISLGYGFIQFKRNNSTEKALATMQFTTIEGNKVELKRSDRTLQSQVSTTKKSAKAIKQTGTKILVRNIPFQAKQHEIQEIFEAFGEIRTVRLPKRMTMGEETHRGFGFVDYYTEADAKKSFEALCQSTHLYGRRLVLEWAAAEEGVEELRKRTAEHFQGSTSSQKKSRKGVFGFDGDF